MKRLLLGILVVLGSCQNNATENATENNVETSSVETKTISNYQCVAKVRVWFVRWVVEEQSVKD
jgi:hypothetical protein